MSSGDNLEEPKLKKTKHNPASDHKPEYTAESLEALFLDLDNGKNFKSTKIFDCNSFGNLGKKSNENDSLNDEIDRALLTFDEFDENNNLGQTKSLHMEGVNGNQETEHNSSFSGNPSPFNSPQDSLVSSISSHEEDYINKDVQKKPQINQSTVSAIKQSMMNTSKFISTFTTLKTTYLKLCKEFNYLLGKFNENERIKIELINENNELKNLLMEIITEREMERKKSKVDSSSVVQQIPSSQKK